MTDEDTKGQEQEQEDTQDPGTSEEKKKTDKPGGEGGGKGQEHMIPKSRFDEVNNANKELKARLDTVEKEQKEATEKRLKEQGQFKQLAEERGEKIAELEVKAKLAEDYEKALTAYIESQIAEIPDNLKSLVPKELTILQQLNWLTANKANLLKPSGLEQGAGERGGGAGKKVELTADQKKAAKALGLSEEDYASGLEDRPRSSVKEKK